jgi:pimeloyl-ACP methyl ester carboxylesterase
MTLPLPPRVALRPLAVACAVALAGACVGPGPLEPALDAAPGIPRVPGARGPLGVATTSWRAPVRVTERRTVAVYVPVDVDGQPVEGPLPALVLVPGGFVAAARYRWMALHAASRGFLVVAPHAPGQLALLAAGDARELLDRVREASAGAGVLAGLVDPEAPAAIAGHSLGGVTAAQAWSADPEHFAALGLLAAYPTAGVRVERQPVSYVVAIVGANDERSTPEQVRERFERFEPARLLATVQGMNHYDWTDTPTDRELASDGPSDRPLREIRADAMRVFDVWLDAAMLDSPLARLQFSNGEFADSIEVYR